MILVKMAGRFFSLIRLSIWILCLFLFVLPRIVLAEPYPEPNPPVSPPTLPEKPPVSYRTLEAPTLEWILHKTEDNLHPDGNEQQRVWLMNRARANPTAEGIWLATTDIDDIASGRSYFQVNLALLQSEFAAIPPRPPAAFDRRLYDAAKEHSLWMIEVDDQSHGGTQDDYPEDTFQFYRITAHGFTYNGAAGNIFAFASSALNAHGALNIDWGNNPPDGMQTGRGHRKAIMGVNVAYPNVGIAMVSENNPATSVGPLVVTDDFAVAATGYADHFNRFLVGTVWADLNGNAIYDPGEGIDSVTVMPDHGTYFAVTANSGGYAIPILSDGAYQVTFSGPSLPAVMKTANVGTVSVLLDLQLFETGDINGDGSIDLTDALVALQVISGLNPEGVDLENYASSGADVNGDRKIGWEEVVYILQRVKGRRP